MEWRQAVRDKIGVFGGLYQIPGITLLESELPPDYERQLCDAIERGREGRTPFRIHLDGFAHTEDRKTIYINVAEQALITPLRQRIADHVRADRRIKKLGVQVPERPLLVVATGLKVAQFEAAWNLLRPHPFTGEVRVNDVVLLKRELADTSLDEHVRTFPFGPAE
jgi:2'-5' RNA ligase